MHINMKKIIYIVITFVSAISFSACSDFFDPKSDAYEKEEDYISEISELYSGYMGVTASVQDVADLASFLEGLRGDLLEPTRNAPSEIWSVYNYDDIKSNSFADPKGYYKVIMNANDYLDQLFAYKAKNPSAVSQTTYKGLVGGVIRYKVWAYLMLARIYGEAVYFDESITSYSDITKYPLLNFDQIIEKCRDLMEVGINGIDGKGEVKWSEELFPTQGASPTSLSWNKICPPYEALLAEIYLNTGDYQKTKELCLSLIARYGRTEDAYQLNLSDYNSGWKSFGYAYSRQEHVVYMHYDYSLGQTNRYIDYYSTVSPSKYYLKPTAAAMYRFERQYNSGGVLNDKYRGSGVTYKKEGNDWVLQKFLGAHATSSLAMRNDVVISLYRASEIHLFLIEALVGLGQFNQALPLFNDGIGQYFNATEGEFTAPYKGYPETLYTTPSKPGDRANRGVRGRVDLQPVGLYALQSATASDTLKNICRLDSLILEEYCLEFAGEAKSLYAMNRIAKRWSNTASKSWASEWINNANNEGPEAVAKVNELWNGGVRSVWASKIAAKYTDTGLASKVKGLLADPNNWFIKYDLKYSGQDLEN